MKSYKAKFLQILITAEGFSVLHFFFQENLSNSMNMYWMIYWIN